MLFNLGVLLSVANEILHLDLNTLLFVVKNMFSVV